MKPEEERERVLNQLKNGGRAVHMANVLIVAIFAGLAWIFGKWWIVLFAIMFTRSYSFNYKWGDKDEKQGDKRKKTVNELRAEHGLPPIGSKGKDA